MCAEELHLCGEASAVDIVEELAQRMGDSFEVRHYERLTRLTTLDVGLGESTMLVDLCNLSTVY